MIIGRPDAPYLVISPAPISEGMNNWFYNQLTRIGILQTDVCVVTIIDEDPENSGSRMSAKQKREAWPRLVQTLQSVNPKVVVALGGDALYMATGHASVLLTFL